METLLLNLVLLNIFLESQKCDEAFQIKIIFCWIIISFIYVLISQHNVKLGYEQSSFTKF
jgi:hypothetical protein